MKVVILWKREKKKGRIEVESEEMAESTANDDVDRIISKDFEKLFDG